MNNKITNLDDMHNLWIEYIKDINHSLDDMYDMFPDDVHIIEIFRNLVNDLPYEAHCEYFL